MATINEEDAKKVKLWGSLLGLKACMLYER